MYKTDIKILNQLLIYTNNFEISLYTTLSDGTIIDSLKNQNENQNSPS